MPLLPVAMKGPVIENEPISHLPYCPTHYYNDLHEERDLELASETLQAMQQLPLMSYL